MAQQLPTTAKLHGYDISDRQFPHHGLLPENVTLGLLNSLEDLPLSLHDQYDVVHLRMWSSNLRARNVQFLLQNIEKMLSKYCPRSDCFYTLGLPSTEPGGFIQWEEADLMHQVVKTDMAVTFEARINDLFRQAEIDYRYLCYSYVVKMY